MPKMPDKNDVPIIVPTSERMSMADMGSTSAATCGVGPTFAIRWLIPRLASFRELAPDIDVRITTGGAAAPFADDWTCGVKLGNGTWPGLVSEHLFGADLIPVCAPHMAQRLKTPRQLKEWLKAAGLGGVTINGPVFEFYGQALQAASDGVGVALGTRPYIDDDLKAGRLVAPFKLSVPKGSQWYLIFKETRRGEPTFSTFRQWITNEIRTS
jgi:LysR family transcriptional regulator, glycine cleavage system transcriptional activator